MKYYISFFSLLLFFSNSTLAQNGYQHLDLSVGAVAKGFSTVNVSFEQGRKYHGALEYTFDYFVTNHFRSYTTIDSLSFLEIDSVANIVHPYRSEFFLVGVAWQKLITRNKNVSFGFRYGLGIGTNLDHMIGNINVGIELDFHLNNNVVLFLRNRNDIVLFSYRQWRTGLTGGIKIPLN